MRRNAWVVGLFGLGLAITSSRPGNAQGLVPPPRPPGADLVRPGYAQGFALPPGEDLERLSRRMAEAVRDLGEDIATTIGQTPNGQFLLRDVQELQRATGEWYATLRGSRDPYQVRRSYSGIDISWHRLQGQLAAPGVAPPAVAEEIRRVDRADAAIHQALDLNAYPASFEGAAAPAGQDETRRLAYTLAQAGENLAATIQANFGADPNAARPINDSAELAQLADNFYDTMNNPAGLQGEALQQAFLRIIEKSNAFGLALIGHDRQPVVKAAWDAYTTPLNLLRINLGLANVQVGAPPQQGPPVGIPFLANPASQVGQWAEELDREVDDLIGNFAPIVPVVHEGREILGDMERLRNDVRNFRGDVMQGLPPNRLAFEFREVDAGWRRLVRRINRVAGGGNGPNFQRVRQIGQTCEQIHRALGMPGYPPVLQPY